jgi:hypothetical protein
VDWQNLRDRLAPLRTRWDLAILVNLADSDAPVRPADLIKAINAQSGDGQDQLEGTRGQAAAAGDRQLCLSPGGPACPPRDPVLATGPGTSADRRPHHAGCLVRRAAFHSRL